MGEVTGCDFYWFLIDVRARKNDESATTKMKKVPIGSLKRLRKLKSVSLILKSYRDIKSRDIRISTAIVKTILIKKAPKPYFHTQHTAIYLHDQEFDTFVHFLKIA